MSITIDLEALPMEEALEFWADKIIMDAATFYGLADEARSAAFTVSGIANRSELESVFTALTNAIKNGTTLADFKKECLDIFESRGWTQGKAWRIDNIFRTNIMSAYNAGRYSQMMEVVDDRPYWMYDAINDSRVRPAHSAMDGRVFRFDNPVWDKWHPPNGFRCRCSLISLSEGQLQRMGLKVEEGDPTGSVVEATDPVTGKKLPPFRLDPDRGFAHNPGRTPMAGIRQAEAEAPDIETLAAIARDAGNG